MMGKPMRFMKCSSSQYEELKADEGLDDNTFYFVSGLSSENTPSGTSTSAWGRFSCTDAYSGPLTCPKSGARVR